MEAAADQLAGSGAEERLELWVAVQQQSEEFELCSVELLPWRVIQLAIIRQ